MNFSDDCKWPMLEPSPKFNICIIYMTDLPATCHFFEPNNEQDPLILLAFLFISDKNHEKTKMEKNISKGFLFCDPGIYCYIFT